VSGADTIQEICSQYGIIAAQAYALKKQLQEYGSEIFERGSKKKTVDQSEDVRKLHATIGKLKVENDFLVKLLNKCH
jgi:transposase-like protein